MEVDRFRSHLGLQFSHSQGVYSLLIINAFYSMTRKASELCAESASIHKAWACAGSGELQLTFTHIDPADWSQPYSISVRVLPNSNFEGQAFCWPDCL